MHNLITHIHSQDKHCLNKMHLKLLFCAALNISAVNVMKSPHYSFFHGIHLNTILEMCSCVHLRSQHNNINFGYKVSPEEG